MQNISALRNSKATTASISIMSLSSIKASAVYKKQDGTISLSKDKRTIYWTPTAPAGGSPTLKISASDLSSMHLPLMPESLLVLYRWFFDC
jgi:hypothetical protein